jgi:arylsulfatase A-like enzyme
MKTKTPPQRNRVLLALIPAMILAFGASTAMPAADFPAQRQPNILLIVSDDAGYADFGFQGCKDIPTPRLDALAAGGVRFTQGYAPGPVCSPSRAGILTGKTPARTGHENNLRDGFGVDAGTRLLPARLKSLGYHTGMIGKWHLGAEKPYLPWERGFDDFYGFLDGQHNYLAPTNKTNLMLRNGKEVVEPEYLTDAFARAAETFIKANNSQPWFLYLAFNAVHSPMQAKPSELEKMPRTSDHARRVLAAMTVSLDQGVGRVLAALERTGAATNTLVVFINDNGGATYSRFYNTPLRGFKGTLFEGGIRVPLLVRWPGMLQAGRTFDAPVTGLDLLPTLLAAAGAQSDTWADSDGVNLLPFLCGNNSARPHSTLFWRFNVVAAVRDMDWKLIRIQDASPLLFNLATDLPERTNLAAEHPDKVRELLAKLTEWEKPFPAPRWEEGGNWDKIHFKDHTGPPKYQGPLSPVVETE